MSNYLSANKNKILGAEEIMLKVKGRYIEKRSDGRYMYRYYLLGKRKYVYAKTQAECKRKAINGLNKKEKIEKQLKKQKERELNPNFYTLETWIPKWIELYKKGSIKDSYIHSIKNQLKNHLLSKPIAKKDITKLTSLELQELIATIPDKKPKENIYDFLNDMLNKAYVNDLIRRNPMIAVQKPTHITDPALPFTIKDQKIFMQKCKTNKYGDFFLILLGTGMRKGELLALDRKDINFKNKTIHVHRTINNDGKLDDAPKTKSSNRIIPIFNSTYKILIKYKNVEGRLFTITAQPIDKNFRKLRSENNFNKMYKIHSLRHSFATRCFENGISPKQVQHWLGHSTIQITLDIYSHILKELEQKNIAKVNEFDTHFDTLFIE